jgi:pimeloyl-ACP methyl ester carboxylesterase/predicted amino acid-binding ACT domain protein
MVSTETTVAGRRATYAIGGRGLPVLFLHGWGLDHRAYRRSLLRLTSRGCRVLAPALPGFGGSAPLPAAERTLEGYAAWVAELVEEVGIDAPMVVLGHSFGGGVATKFVHDRPDLARYLVILNSVGDPASFAGGILSRVRDPRTLFSLDPLQFLLPTADGATIRMIPRVFVENVMRDPLAVADAGRVAMSADLGTEMAVLAERGLPTLVLWSDHDGVIPMSAFDTFCSTFGADGQVVSGGHSWLLASPDVFGQVLDNVLHVQATDDHTHAATVTVEQLRELLASTTLPRRVVRQLLDGVSPLWAMSATPPVLAGDLALCHPRLRRNEVRAVARRIRGSDMYRLTVVASDRAGLLADSAAVLASEGVSVVAASATTWPERHQALHSITVRGDGRLDAARWESIGERLRVVAKGGTAPTPFVPSGRVNVTLTGAGDNRSVVRVTAPDRVGLLAAVCRWFADHDVSVEAASVETVDGVAKDVFLVAGSCDVDALVQRLSRRRRCPLRPVAGALLASFG